MTWFSGDSVEGDVIDKVCSGIDESEVVVVCISQAYLDKVGGKHGPLDTCKKEFEYAERTKGVDKLVAVVMDPAVRNPREWRGGVGMVLGSHPFKDLSMDESEATWEANLNGLYMELMALLKGERLRWRAITSMLACPRHRLTVTQAFPRHLGCQDRRHPNLKLIVGRAQTARDQRVLQHQHLSTSWK